MRRLFHKMWPLMAVVSFSVILALQIPAKALFFKPLPVEQPAAFASFVSYDSAAYERVLRHARMSWQLRVTPGRTHESHVDAFDFAEEVPLPKPLELPDEFVRIRASDAVVSLPVPLLPPSLADVTPLVPVAMPPEGTTGKRRVNAELLEIPESLQTQE